MLVSIHSSNVSRRAEITKKLEREDDAALPELSVCFTHPDYRHQGVASMMIEYEVKKADELGIECFLEANSLSMPLYKIFQYVVVD